MNRKAKKAVKELYDYLPWPVKSVIRDTFPLFFVESLYKQLPVSVPHSLHIDIGNLCNFKCTFCPTGDSILLSKVGRPKGMMSFDLFKKIIDDLKEITESA